LSRGEKALLIGALNGLEDAEVAVSLKRTPAAIEPELSRDTVGGVRGPQKRHRIFNYLRNHPEELRPYKTA
jgi:hypothetical protein